MVGESVVSRDDFIRLLGVSEFQFHRIYELWMYSNMSKYDHLDFVR